MKKYFTYIATFLALASCSSEDIVVGTATDMGNVEEASGIKVEIEAPVGYGDEDVTRSTLVYDDAEGKMLFGWEAEDCIGVFALGDALHQQQQRFTQAPGGDTSDRLTRWFQTQDNKLKVEGGKDFVAYMPYIDAPLNDFTKIEVDYTGQTQTSPVDFSDYWGGREKYLASQPNASKHLSDYDFACSGIVGSTNEGKLHLTMNRMGAIVRFWLVIDPKNNYVYDEIQLVNKEKAFTTMANMNAEAKELETVETSNMMSLKLGKGGSGFDLSDPTQENGQSTNPFYDYYNGKFTGYIMAYMMIAPIDLTGVASCELYLTAHVKGNPDNKRYFKSEGLSKPNLKPNSFHKWTVYPNEDTPISFSEITVQQWKKGTEFTNGVNGTGTETW